MPTRSNPRPSNLFSEMPKRIFVPIPSVDVTKIGSLYLHDFKSNKPPKLPIFPILPGLFVFEERGSISLIRLSVERISTPASL